METKNQTTKEERFLSDDAVLLMSMLPKGLTDEWQEKAFKVFGRTKAELAAPDMLKALIMVKENMFNCKYEDMTQSYKYKYDMITNAINKATK